MNQNTKHAIQKPNWREERIFVLWKIVFCLAFVRSVFWKFLSKHRFNTANAGRDRFFFSYFENAQKAGIFDMRPAAKFF